MHYSCFTHLKPVFLVIIFLSLLNVHAQPLNRVYTSFSSGYRKHQEFVLTIHVFNHFSFAWNVGETHIPTGPVYYPGDGFLNFGKSLKNEYQSQSFFFGFTTQRFKSVNYSLMLGPSFNNSLEYTNIVVHENEYTHGEWVTKTAIQLSVWPSEPIWPLVCPKTLDSTSLFNKTLIRSGTIPMSSRIEHWNYRRLIGVVA